VGAQSPGYSTPSTLTLHNSNISWNLRLQSLYYTRNNTRKFWV